MQTSTSSKVPSTPGAPLDGPIRAGSGAMFDRIAQRYDLLNRIISLGMDQGWRKRLVRSLDGDSVCRILDLATGTADVALSIASAYPLVKVTGLDPSVGMLEVGRVKVKKAGLQNRIELVEGDALAMPFADDTFQSSCVSFGIRNFPDRFQGLCEMARVTRPGGTVAILELAEPREGILAPFARFHVHHVVPRLGALLSGNREYRYLQSSIEVFPPPAEFTSMMREAGLNHIQAKSMGFGAAYLFTGKVPEA